MGQLDESLNQRLQEVLRRRGVNLRQVHKEILQLSDFYLLYPGSPTPWRESFAANAYLSYFLPLNFVRLKEAFREVQRFLPSSSYDQVWDFGSGVGTTHWVLESEADLTPKPLFALESADSAIALHRQLMEIAPTRWPVTFTHKAKPSANALAVFSYAFLEMQNQLPDLGQFQHLLLVEPSTRDCGRKLMQWRQKLMIDGFQPLAPCTHSQACPLLEHSQRDWCHQRIPFAGPDWWQTIEEHLPMKNRTLTYSYLLLSRSVQDSEWRGTARVIGDTLKERGKTRQMICRGPQREFVSWLHKKGDAPYIPHGALLSGLEQAESHGPEVRPQPGTLKWTQ
jgi:ribosomal protein RSM22 (predicted rRNA methylase)